MLRRVAAAGDVDHRRHVELDHLLVERVVPLVGHRRRVEVAAGRIGIQVAADEAHLHAALELGDGVLRRHAGRLRKLADADEVLRIERHDPVDQVVADLGPFPADALVADVVAHAGGARREDREVGAALALKLELVGLDAFPDLVVGHLQARAGRHRRLVLGVGRRGLILAEAVQVLRLGRVVAVTVDDHGIPPVIDGLVRPDATTRGGIVKPRSGTAARSYGPPAPDGRDLSQAADHVPLRRIVEYPEVADPRHDRHLGFRRALGKDRAERLRIDRLVVGTDHDQGRSERAKVILVAETRMIRGVEPVGVRQRLRAVPEFRRLVEFDGRQSVEAVNPDRVERKQSIEAPEIQVGPAASCSLPHRVRRRDGWSQQQITGYRRGMGAAGKADGEPAAAGMAAQSDRDL